MDSKKLLFLAAGAAALYYLSNKSGPTYYDMNGKAITGMSCGGSATFNVPGHDRIWLSLLKDKVLSFDGPFDLPMPAYIFNCTNDIGTYDVAAYEIDANGVKGNLIGQTQFTVFPQA